MGAHIEARRLGLGGPQEFPTSSDLIADAPHHRHKYGDDYIGAMEVAQRSSEGRITQPALGAAL